MKNRKAKTMKRRFMSLLLALAMIVTMIPATEVKAAGETVDLGEPVYVEGSTDKVHFPNATVTEGTPKIKTVLVSIELAEDSNKVSIDWSGCIAVPTITDREDEAGTGHQTAAWIKADGWEEADVNALIKALQFSYVEGAEVRVIVDANDVSNNLGTLGATITYKIYEGNGHYYMYVPYDPAESDYTDEQSKVSQPAPEKYTNPTWMNAYNFSKEFRFMGMKGYLATITSSAEAELLHSINNMAAWCGGTLLVTNDANMEWLSTDPDIIAADSLKVYDGDDAAKRPQQTKNDAKRVEHNRGLYYWACGPEAGDAIDSGLWDPNEPNHNTNTNNEALNSNMLSAQNNETCVIANYYGSIGLNDIKEGNYNEANASRAARAFGYFVEFGGYETESYDRGTAQKVLNALKAEGVVKNGTFTGATEIWAEEEYKATIAPNTGYMLPNSKDYIKVTVGGQELKPEEYTYNSTTGEITIPAAEVTGDVKIEAECIKVPPYKVTDKITNGTFTGDSTIASENIQKDYTATITPDDGYQLPDDITVTVNNKPLNPGEYDWDKTTGKVVVKGPYVIGDIHIEAVCTPKDIKVTGEVTGGTFDGKGATIDETIKVGTEYTTTVKPNDGYSLPATVEVKVGDKVLTAGTDYTYDSTTGEVKIKNTSVTGDVNIKAICVKNYNVTETTENSSFTGDKTVKPGATYEATVTPDEGYELPKDITVTINGKEVSDDSYDWDPSTGKITIPGGVVTGDIDIKVVCTKDDGKYDVTHKVTNGEFDGDDTVEKGEDYEATITPDDGYTLPEDIKVTVGGKELSDKDYDWDPETGEIYIPSSSITGNIKITAKCTKDTYDVEDDITNGSFKGKSEVEDGEDYEATITPDDGYELPDKITVTVNGEKLDSSDYTWDPKTGKLKIDGSVVSGDIKITAKCTKIGSSGNGSGSGTGSNTNNTTTVVTPKTGDEMNIILYAALMILAIGGFAGCVVWKIKNREPKNN